MERDPSSSWSACAEDAERAIELADEHQPDVAVLDWVMPGGGGAVAAREILLRSPDTKIVALTLRRASRTRRHTLRRARAARS